MRAFVWAVVVSAMLAVAARADTAQELEARAKAFYDLVERGQKDRASATWPDLERDLAAKIDTLEKQLGELRDDLEEAEGGGEGSAKSSAWRELEVPSMVLSYHLAWVRYQAGQLTDGAKKRNLLEDAIDGFSRFTSLNELGDIQAESLYGRGLSYMDLGEKSRAREDFTAAAKEARTSAKARAALAELARGGGGGKPGPPPPEPPNENDPEVLVTKVGPGVKAAAQGDQADEKAATELARGLAARGGDWPGRIQKIVLDALGAASPGDVRSSFGLRLLAQLAIDRGRCADVAPLAAASDGVQDGGRSRHRPEILFMEAGCRLNGGKPREAAELFASLIAEFPDSPRAAESAYFRFRALDMARGNDPALNTAYEQALGQYVDRYGKADGAGEARWLQGEAFRARGDCTKAEAAYAQVTGGAYANRAKLAAIECRVGRLGAKEGAPDRAAVLNDLKAFVAATPGKGDTESLVARAALMGGLVADTAKPPDYPTVIAFLDDFEGKYAGAGDLHASAVETRVKARVALGELDAATKDMDTFLANATAEKKKTLAQLGRDLAGRAERGGDASAVALTLARKVYAKLVELGGGSAERIALAAIELKTGNAAAARTLYDAVLATEPDSSEALRGAAKAAANAGDRAGAMGYWRKIVEASNPGGTAWYEARIAQVELLVADGKKPEACTVLRQSLGRSSSTGGDVLGKRLREMEPAVCK